MDIDVNKIKDAASTAANTLDKSPEAKAAVDKAIEKVEDKVGKDLPSADDIIKVVK